MSRKLSDAIDDLTYDLAEALGVPQGDARIHLNDVLRNFAAAVLTEAASAVDAKLVGAVFE